MNQKHARPSIMIIIETGRGPVKDQFKFDNFFGILNIVNYSQHRCVASILSVDNLENNQLVMCQAQKVSTRSTFPNLSWFPREPSLSGQTSSTRLSWRPGGQLMVASLRGCTMSRHVEEEDSPLFFKKILRYVASEDKPLFLTKISWFTEATHLSWSNSLGWWFRIKSSPIEASSRNQLQNLLIEISSRTL